MAGSSNDHLMRFASGALHAENQNSPSTIGLLIGTHGLPQTGIQLPDEGNGTDRDTGIEKDSDDNDDNKKDREPPFHRPGCCRRCGKKLMLSRFGFVECEQCDRYWGYLNGYSNRAHAWRPPGYASGPGATSQPSPAMRSQDASHGRNQQQVPPLVSNYVKPKHDVPPPPPPPQLQQRVQPQQLQGRRSGPCRRSGGRSTVGMNS